MWSFNPPPASSAEGTSGLAVGGLEREVSTHPPLRQRREPLASQVSLPVRFVKRKTQTRFKPPRDPANRSKVSHRGVQRGRKGPRPDDRSAGYRNSDRGD